MSLGSKIKRKMSMRTLHKGMDEMGTAVKAFKDDVGTIPCSDDKCADCKDCRARAQRLQLAIEKYFAVYLKRGRK